MDNRYSRRVFLRSMMGLGFVLVGADVIQAQSPHAARTYHGQNLDRWIVALGDATYNQPDEPEVNLSDIETLNYDHYSLLRANIHVRDIMAHNITFKRFTDTAALDFTHLCSYQFRLPYMPSTQNQGKNPQTIEGGLFIWNGLDTDYGLAFQWVLNPWQSDFGDIYTWNKDGTGWTYAGALAVDTQWHQVQFELDVNSEYARLMIDKHNYPAAFSRTSKTGFGTDIAARLQAEIVSLYPGESGSGALHEAEFKNWHWLWRPHK